MNIVQIDGTIDQLWSYWIFCPLLWRVFVYADKPIRS